MTLLRPWLVRPHMHNGTEIKGCARTAMADKTEYSGTLVGDKLDTLEIAARGHGQMAILKLPLDRLDDLQINYQYAKGLSESRIMEAHKDMKSDAYALARHYLQSGIAPPELGRRNLYKKFDLTYHGLFRVLPNPN